MCSQKTYIAITVYHEARGESIDGQIAVAQVILNRAEQKHQTPREIIFTPKQFSCFNEAQPPIKDYAAFVIAMEAVERCMEHRIRGDTLYGANHYFNPKVVLPFWASKMEKVASIGNHDFYRD
jgi:spore germination cell wall hydrolase CwlJ-like protein